jgi:signal transduction histidine kinase
MFGVAQREFTPELLKSITEETILLSDNIPSDPVELREKILKGKILKYRAEMLVSAADGVKKWIRDSCVSVNDDKTGRSLGLVGIFTDITAQRQAAMHLEKALERATESDRLKTAFLNNLPHEIRTPLNAIVGFSTLLNEPGQLSDAKLEFQEIITHSSDHLLEIVDDVVEISKIEANAIRLNRKEVNVNEMLQRLYDRFKPAAEEKNIALQYDVNMNAGEVIITTDGYKLFQSINNLLSNAVKFTFVGQVRFGITIKEDKLEFHVSDTGIGIGEEHQPNIFKPFFQAESSNTKRYEGTGLGLSIAKAYIELLGGEIWFTSKQAEGSAFCFNIPDTRHNNGMKGLVL